MRATGLSANGSDSPTASGTSQGEDALDAFRLLQAVATADLVHGLTKHRGELNAAAVADEAVQNLRLHATTPRGRIALLAASAAGGDATVAPAFAALCNDLLAALR